MKNAHPPIHDDLGPFQKDCNLWIAFLTFCEMKNVGVSHVTWLGKGGRAAWKCHMVALHILANWLEVSCVLGCFSLNIFHALFFPCSRNNQYTSASSLAKYNLYYFLTKTLGDYICLFKHTNTPGNILFQASPWFTTFLIIPTILCGSTMSE